MGSTFLIKLAVEYAFTMVVAEEVVIAVLATFFPLLVLIGVAIVTSEAFLWLKWFDCIFVHLELQLMI